MKTTTAKRLGAGVLAALSFGAVTCQGAATLIAYWDFEKVEADGITIKSKVGNYAGEIQGSAVLTEAGGGRPGAGGGKGLDERIANPGWLLLAAGGLGEGDANPFTACAADDSMTVVMWEKNDSNINSSSMWAIGPGFDRAWNFHIPWSDGTIYFDTAGGCCAVPTQRLNANVLTVFPDHDWLGWHHYAFIKDGGYKGVYVDGQLLVSQDDGAAPMPTEYTQLTIGGENNSNPPDAIIDDVAFYKGRLTEDEIKALAAGGSPGKPPTDTDGDGMPDDWETRYGLNPNDASDAPKDLDGDGISNLDEFKAGTDPADETPPTLVSAAVGASNTSVSLTFSEAVDDTTAADKSHYSISPSLEIISAAHTKGNIVVLTTAVQPSGGAAYTVSVTGVLDQSKNLIAPGSTALFFTALFTKDSVASYPAYFLGSGTYTVNGGGASGNAGDFALNTTLAGGPVVANATAFLAAANAATALDELSVAFWQKKLDTADSSAFTLHSPKAGNNRGFHAHVPWSNQHIYFDTTGCCDGATQRIEASVPDTFGPYADVGDATWFTSQWHLYVFTKKGSTKNIWIDGLSFLVGDSTNPLLTDHTALYIGSGAGGAEMSHALIDNFSMYGKELTEANVVALKNGTLPSALPAATGLIAWWNFNDFPANGIIGASTPTANAKTAGPALVKISHTDGTAVWDKSKASLQIDGAAVAANIDKAGGVTTVAYLPSPVFASQSKHTATLLYDGALVYQWSFTVLKYTGATLDKVGSYPALLEGSAVYTADAGGHTAKAGDFGIDLTKKGGPVVTYDTGFTAAVNAATAHDELSVAFWQKKLDIADSSAFTINSPSTPYGRGFHSHLPWSNQHIYFDTVGCCDAVTQRIEASVPDTFAPYADVGDSTWWTAQWHHFALSKKGSAKSIWIDGLLFLTGDSTAPLPTDVDSFFMGSGGFGAELSHAIIDDFAVFGKELTEANVVALKNGTLPTALPAATGLIAYWDYNDKNAVALTELYASDTVSGTYTKEAGATVNAGTKTITTAVSGNTRFYRVLGASPGTITVSVSGAIVTITYQ